jgi:hypothetical protein
MALPASSLRVLADKIAPKIRRDAAMWWKIFCVREDWQNCRHLRILLEPPLPRATVEEDLKLAESLARGEPDRNRKKYPRKFEN